jgi:hypothetical protein
MVSVYFVTAFQIFYVRIGLLHLHFLEHIYNVYNNKHSQPAPATERQERDLYIIVVLANGGYRGCSSFQRQH